MSDASMSDASMSDASTLDAGEPVDAGVDDSTCAGRSRWIYLLSFDQELLRFEPSADNTVTRLGRIRCPDTVSNEPFDTNSHNMTVDRSGRAWLFDQGGALYHVDTSDASCTGTTFEVDQTEFEFLAATFVYDVTSTSTTTPQERLLVSGGPSNNGDGENWSNEIATIDPDTLAFTELQRVGSGGAVLLTSSGDGRLWSIANVDGEAGLFPTEPSTGEVRAQDGGFPAEVGSQSSIVFWGGRFYVFTANGDSGTLVHTYTPSTDAWELVMALEEQIVGSGVSTCAPVVLI